jgi:lauroyl/myristoyl acyltransferase
MDKALWLLVSGCDEWEVARRMEALEDLARTSDGRPWIKSVTFPTTFWPNAERRRANLVALTNISNRRESVRHAVLAAGFSDDAFELAERVFSTWERVSASSEASWPTNEANRWILEKVSARTPTGWLALGIVEPATNPAAAYAGAMASLGKEISRNGARLTGWTALGEGLLEHAERRLPWVVGAMIALLALCLWLAFGNAREMLLSFATLALAFLCLLALMSLVGWSWNLMNLMAAPLLMGVGVDYTIHTQLALRRYRGNAVRFRRTTGRALLLCSATTIAGFGSLAWAGNAGLASLGKLCATGIACVLVLSLFLLPAWWRALQASNNESPTQPSSLYRTEVWRFGLIAGRLLPRRAADYLSRLLGLCYYRLQPRRGEIVARNLLPVLNGDRLAAKRAARSLFKEFAMKIADLWRFESGVAVEEWLNEWTGLEHLSAAHSRGRGVLLVTPHLGNWELGGAFMRKHGIQLLVLTQSEPEPRLTKIRQKARARWGIETVVVGTDPFAFVEIIKRLQEGAVVALLVDRPPPETAVDVELFGQPFRASNAAADLARASGSAILPVYVVREGKGYNAHILPEVVYDRAAISDRAARTRLTQEILRAFEPVIRQHHTQWYHFVPIWPDKNAG